MLGILGLGRGAELISAGGDIRAGDDDGAWEWQGPSGLGGLLGGIRCWGTLGVRVMVVQGCLGDAGSSRAGG